MKKPRECGAFSWRLDPRLRGDDVDALLVDETQAGIGEPHLDPAVLALDPELAVLEVREVTTLGLVVGVGHVVSDSGGLPRHLANSGHAGPRRGEESKH